MKRLPQAKKKQLFGVIVGTLTLISLIYFLLISPQNMKNASLGSEITGEGQRLEQYRAAITQVATTSAGLTNALQQLALAEQDVASGDLYEWTLEKMRSFKAAYHVDIPAPTQPAGPGDCDMISGFPYKEIRFSLSGTAYYHDLGKFISDFENKFPHCRVLNLAAEPAGSGPNGGEKLNFRMDIVTLVKPNS